jgi:hypothetical protein
MLAPGLRHMRSTLQFFFCEGNKEHQLDNQRLTRRDVAQTRRGQIPQVEERFSARRGFRIMLDVAGVPGVSHSMYQHYDRFCIDLVM